MSADSPFPPAPPAAFPSVRPGAFPSARARGVQAYVLKMYPRFSETFIVSEILAREAAGEEFVIFSLRPTTDTRFHPELARVRAPVIQVERPSSARSFWLSVQAATQALTGTTQALTDTTQALTDTTQCEALLPELLRLDHDDAVQSLSVARLALEHGVTHLHAHFASVATTVARAASLLTGIPYSFTTHAKDIFHESVDLSDLRRKTLDSHHTVAISEYNRTYLRAALGEGAAAKIALVRNGLELDRFAYRPHAGPRTPGLLRLLAIGRLVEKKGFGHLIEALAHLREAGTAVHLDLVGDGPLLPALQAAIVEHELGDAVTLHGPLTQAEVRDMFDTHDLLVAPFVIGADGNADGLPTVLLEAMASGIPCIAGNVTVVPEVIETGVTGWLVDGHSPGSIAATIAEAVRVEQEAPGTWRRMTDAARARIVESHDSRRQARALRHLSTAAPVAEPDPFAGARERELEEAR